MWNLFLLMLLTLILSAFFSGTETAFMSANKLGVEIERDKGTRRSLLIAGFYAQPGTFLSTLMVANMVVLVIFGYCMILLLDPMLSVYILTLWIRYLLIILLSTITILVLGEYFPKILFRAYPNRAIVLVAYPIRYLQVILRLPVWIIMTFSNLVIRYILRAPAGHARDAFTRLDLQDYVEGSIHTDSDEMEAGMFKNALQLKNRKVRECMVPRTEIVHIDLEDGLEELRRVFLESRHSRIIVSKDDIDHILGYVHHQSLLGEPRPLDKLIMPIQHIPEVTNVLDVMTHFKRQKHNMVVVVDEYGGTAGIVTLEDIAEEIFGEIEDEHDQEEYIEQQISEYEFVFSARLEIDYLNEKYPQLRLPVGEYETLSGYIVMTSGEIPDMGDEIELEHFRFIIEKVSDKKIEEVRVMLTDEEEQ